MIYYLDPDSASVCISALPWQNPIYNGLKCNMKQRYLKLWKTCTKIQMEDDDDGKPSIALYWINYRLHREHDKPAIEYANGNKAWYKNGQRHRDDDNPAVEHVNGYKEWFKNDQLHRENDMPAIEYANGGKEWYKNGQRYREHSKSNMHLVLEYERMVAKWFV